MRWFVGEAVLALEFIRDSFAQFGNARSRRVFSESGGERFGAGVFDVLRRVKIRFARAETNDIFTCCLHGFGLGINDERE